MDFYEHSRVAMSACEMLGKGIHVFMSRKV